MSGSIQFGGYSVTSIKSDCGWGSQESSMTFGLVADPGNIPLGIIPDAAPNLSNILGTPGVFALDTGFSFQGILESFSENGSQSGFPLFDAKIVDPRFLLANYTIICKDYPGPVSAPNVLNAYGGLGFTDSKMTANGMYFDVVRLAIERFTNNPASGSSMYGGPMTFNGIRYAVDLSQIPFFTGITIPDFKTDLLSMISSVCSQLALDYFVELNGFVITVRVVSTYNQFPVTALQDLVANGLGNNVSSYNRGVSLAKENTTSSMLVGPNIEQIYLTNNGSRYYGKDFNGNPIFGQPALVTLVKRSLNGASLPSNEEEDAAGWQGDDQFKYYKVYTDIVPVLIKNNKLAYLLGTTVLVSMLFELELAHECKIGGDGGNDESFQDYLKRFRYDLHLALGGPAGTSKPNLFRDSGFGETLQDERAGIQGIDEYSENVQLLMDALNETYSDMGFAFSIGDQIYVRNEGDKYQFSRELTQSAWFKEFEDGQVQFGDGYNITKLINASDLRFKPFLISEKEVTGSISSNLGGYVVPVESSAEMVLAVPGNQGNQGIPYTNSPAFVTNDLAIYSYGMQFDKYPYPIWNTLMAVLKSETMDAGLKTVRIKTGTGQKKTGGRFIDVPNNPIAAGIPVRDKLLSYGPWGVIGRAGKTEVELEPSLTPWNWGSTALMDAYGKQKVASNLSFLQYNEEGDLTVTGLPNTEFGNIMQMVGVSLSSININIDSKSGFQTTYRFRRFSPKFGTLNQTRINQLKTFSDGLKDVRSRVIETASSTDYSLAELGLSARAGRDALVRAKKRVKSGKLGKNKNSPHIYFMSTTDASITDNDNQVIANNIYTGDQEDIARFCTGFLTTDVQNMAAMSLDGLIRPFLNFYGAYGEVPGPLENLKVYLPVLTNPENETALLNSVNLNPFNVFNDVQSIYAASFLTGQNQLAETTDVENVKPFALRGPLMVSGWGFDRYTLQAVPKVGEDRISEPYPDSNDNKESTVQQNNSFKTGPVDLVWDEARGVWTNNSIATFYIDPEDDPIKAGEFGSGYIYINDLQSLVTKGNEYVKVRIFNGSGREWNDRTDNSINNVIGLFDANLNTWFGLPIDIDPSGKTEDVPYVHSVSCSGNSLVIEKKVMKFKNGILKEVVDSGSGAGTSTTTLSPTTTTPSF